MPSIEVLEKLFGSRAKVKVLRLFLFHPDQPFDSAMIRVKAKIKAPQVRKIMNTLEKIKLVKRKTFEKEGKGKKRKVRGWVLNRDFKYLKPLQVILIGMNPMSHNDVAERFKQTGKIKLVIVAGVFIQNDESRIDLLIAGDALKERSIKTAVENLQAEIGKDLRYTVFTTEEFLYRHGMYDKLIRDVLDFPHTVVVDKIKLSTHPE